MHLEVTVSPLCIYLEADLELLIDLSSDHKDEDTMEKKKSPRSSASYCPLLGPCEPDNMGTASEREG